MSTPKDWMESLPQPIYEIKVEREVSVPMRDGLKLSVNIFRPDAIVQKFLHPQSVILLLMASGSPFELTKLTHHCVG
jgi:predicted acyl esterase